MAPPSAAPPLAQASSPNEPVDDAGRVRRLAELLWQRVEQVRERAEREAQGLAERLDAYGDALGRPPLGKSAESAAPLGRDSEAKSETTKQQSRDRTIDHNGP